jgi:hypothetical protein
MNVHYQPALFDGFTPAQESDEYYTPRWVFTAAALTFDLDVAAPVNPAYRTCPAREFYTREDDGLSSPWFGRVWLNPPYSGPWPWVERFAHHPNGMALLPAMREVRWMGDLLGSADAVALVSPTFGRPDESGSGRIPYGLLLAARGAECVAALARVAHADRYARGAYLVRPDG